MTCRDGQAHMPLTLGLLDASSRCSYIQLPMYLAGCSSYAERHTPQLEELERAFLQQFAASPRELLQDARTDDDAMSAATALGVSEDLTLHVGYTSSHSSESGLKGRPRSPDSPLLWAGGPTAHLTLCTICPTYADLLQFPG